MNKSNNFQATWSKTDCKLPMPGTENSSLVYPDILTPFERSQCTSSFGQHTSGSIYKQARGNKIILVMPPDMGFDANSNQDQNGSVSGPFSRQTKCSGEQPKPSQS